MCDGTLDSEKKTVGMKFPFAAYMRGLPTSHTFILFLALATGVLLPDSAFAGPPTDPLSGTICLVVSWLTGELGSAIATLGVIVIALGAMLGKVSWGLAITVAVGISIMFGGSRIVELLVQPQNAGVCNNVASALGPGAMADVLCRLGEWAAAPMGRAMATIAVGVLGISMLFGKVSYPMVLIISSGIAAFVRATDIAEMLSAGQAVSFGCSP